MTNFVNLLDSPYSRRGSYIAFANDNYGEDLYGKCGLWICNCRVVGFAMENLGADSGYRQIRVEALKDGVSVPYIIRTTPYEVIVETHYGQIRFCIGERRLAMAKCADGLSMRLTPRPKFFSPGCINMRNPEGSWFLDFKLGRLLATPVKGKTSAGAGYVEFMPDEEGIMLVALEDYVTDPILKTPAQYPPYEKAVETVQKDFDGFCRKVMPSLPG